MLIPKEKRRKLDKKCEVLTFIGYDEHSNGYRFVNTVTGKLTISRDAKFTQDVKQIDSSTADISEFPLEILTRKSKPNNQIREISERTVEVSDEDEFFESLDENTGGQTDSTFKRITLLRLRYAGLLAVPEENQLNSMVTI